MSKKLSRREIIVTLLAISSKIGTNKYCLDAFKETDPEAIAIQEENEMLENSKIKLIKYLREL